MSQKTVAEKLGVESGHRLLLFDPPSEYDDALGEPPPDVERSDTPEGSFDVVQVFVADSDAFDARIRTAMDATEPDGRLWVTYPKKSSDVESDLSRDVLADLMDDLGWRGARQIAVDETWSAIWFRPRD